MYILNKIDKPGHFFPLGFSPRPNSVLRTKVILISHVYTTPNKNHQIIHSQELLLQRKLHHKDFIFYKQTKDSGVTTASIILSSCTTKPPWPMSRDGHWNRCGGVFRGIQNKSKYEVDIRKWTSKVSHWSGNPCAGPAETRSCGGRLTHFFNSRGCNYFCKWMSTLLMIMGL